MFEPTTVRRLVQPFGSPDVGAVAGNAKVANRNSLIARWQHIEYVIGFNVDRRVYDLLSCMPTVPGAVGAFRRDVLLQVGGVSDDTLAEDTEGYAKPSLKKCRPIAARNEDKKVFSGRL